MTGDQFLSIAIELGLFLIMAGIALGFVRLVLGPTNADRIVALDMMTVNIVAFCAVFSVRSSSSAFLDVAIVLALVGFLTTLALARFAERQMKRRAQPEPPLPADEMDQQAAHTDSGETDP